MNNCNWIIQVAVNVYVSNVLNRESLFGVGSDGVPYSRPEPVAQVWNSGFGKKRMFWR